MFLKRFLFFVLTFATAAAAQNFLLDVDYSVGIPTGSILGEPANLSAATDAQGNVYVLVNGVIQGPVAEFGNSFVPVSYLVKLSPGGYTVLFQMMLPSPMRAMSVDPAGNIYLAGGNSVEKLSTDGTKVLYQTVVGGGSMDAFAIALDPSGRVYLTGSVYTGDLTATPGALQQTGQAASEPNGFVMRINSSGGTDWATFLGVAVDNPYGIAVDASGSAFVFWATNSTALPVTNGAYRTSGLSMLARLTPDGSGLIYSTFAGGDFDAATYIAVDSNDYASVAFNSAYGWGLPVRRFNPQGTGVTFATSLAGQSLGGLAADASGLIYVYDSVIPFAANYPAKNSLSQCTPAMGNALTVFEGSGAIVQSTFLPSAETPMGLTVLPGETADLFTVPPLGGVASMTHLFQNPQAQTVQLACIGNAASYDNESVSPGEIVSLFGSGLGPATGTQPDVTLATGFPTKTANVQVTFNGVPGPLLYVQDSQINAIVPWSFQGGPVCVVYNGASTNCLTPVVTPSHPGIFTVAPYTAAALNQDGSLNSASNPAKVGSIVSIFATGLGAISPAQPDGSIVGFPLPVNELTIGLSTVSELQQSMIPDTVNYAGPAPLEVAGLSQINFTVSAQMASPSAGFSRVTVGPSTNQGLSNFFYVYVTQ